MHELRENLTEDVETLRYGEKNLPEGDLYQASTLQSAEGELLTVETQQAKAFYLRGFVGSVYRDGCWEPLPDSALGGDNAGLLQWLAAQGFDPLTQSALYWQLDGDAPEANTMHIRVQDASLGWNTAALDEKIAACFMDVEPGEYTRVCRLIERTSTAEMLPTCARSAPCRAFCSSWPPAPARSRCTRGCGCAIPAPERLEL